MGDNTMGFEDLEADRGETLARHKREIDRLKQQIAQVLAENEELHTEHQRVLDSGRTKDVSRLRKSIELLHALLLSDGVD